MSENITKITKKVEEKKEEEAILKSMETEPDYRHVFSEPFTWMGTTYETLDFHFGDLKGKDALAIYAELQAKGQLVISPRASQQYQMCLAAKASGLGTDAFENMPLKDFETILGKARNFIPSAALF